MKRILTLFIIILVAISCKTESKKGSSTTRNEKTEVSEVEKPKINPEIIESFFSNEYVDSLEKAKQFVTVEEIIVNEKTDTLHIFLQHLTNWEDPGDFLKVQIRNTKDSIVFEQKNINGWVKFGNNYTLPDSVVFLSQVKSDKAIIIENRTGKQLIVFGYVYASQPGLMTIIDLFPTPQIIFNKNFELRSISEPTEKGYKNFEGGTTVSNEVVLNMETMKIEK